jgi:hypothetical protein
MVSHGLPFVEVGARALTYGKPNTGDFKSHHDPDWLYRRLHTVATAHGTGDITTAIFHRSLRLSLMKIAPEPNHILSYIRHDLGFLGLVAETAEFPRNFTIFRQNLLIMAEPLEADIQLNSLLRLFYWDMCLLRNTLVIPHIPSLPDGIQPNLATCPIIFQALPLSDDF